MCFSSEIIYLFVLWRYTIVWTLRCKYSRVQVALAHMVIYIIYRANEIPTHILKETYMLGLFCVSCWNKREQFKRAREQCPVGLLPNFTFTSWRIYVWSKPLPGGMENVWEKGKKTVFWLLIGIKILSTPTLTFNEVKVNSHLEEAVEAPLGRQTGNEWYVGMRILWYYQIILQYYLLKGKLK